MLERKKKMILKKMMIKMSEDILDQNDKHYHGMMVTRFLGKKGTSIQFTEGNSYPPKGYVQMTLDEAIDFLNFTLKELKKIKKENK